MCTSIHSFMVNGLAPLSLSFLNANYQKFKHQGKKNGKFQHGQVFCDLPVSFETDRCWSRCFGGISCSSCSWTHTRHSRATVFVFFLLLANFECSNKKRSVQNEETAVWFKSMASHLGAIRVGMSWFDPQERCQTLFRTEYTVITPALQLPYSVVCGFLLWAHQCNSVPTIRHRLDGLLHTYARIRSANHPLLICMLTISTVLMREMRIPCAPALRCEEK